MIKLYGFAASNYYNTVKHALLAKKIPHEEFKIFPGQTDDYLNKSPLGKVPCIETQAGYLSEASVILEYLEDTYPDIPMYPAAAFDKAKTRQIMKCAELYVELPARRHLPEILLKAPRSGEAFEQAKALIIKGIQGLDQLSQYTPYLCGQQLTYADIVVRYVLSMAQMVGQNIYDWDPLDESERLKTWSENLAQDPISQRVDADQKVGVPEFMAYISDKLTQ